MPIEVKVTKYKSRPFEYALSISKWPARSVFIVNIVYYLTYLLAPSPRDLAVDIEGSSIFPIIML